MSLATLMIHTVDLKTETQTKDANGYPGAPVLSLVTPSMPCRFTIMKPQEAAVYYGKYDTDVYARVYFNSDPALVLIGSWITFNTIDYEVIAIANAGGMIGRLWQVDVIRKAF